LGAGGVAVLTVIEGALFAPDAIIQEAIDWVQDPLNPAKIPIIGPLGKVTGDISGFQWGLDMPNVDGFIGKSKIEELRSECCIH
jgi:hypothetical protein